MLAEMFASYSGMEKIYLFCAIIGGVFFVLRLILQFIGGDAGDSDLDIDGADGMDGDMDLDGSDTDYSFKVLSLQAITAFLTMFGLVGLAISKQTSLGTGFSLFGALAAGSATVWILKQIFEAALNLQSSGTMNLKKNAIGVEGTVYLTIPQGGIGKVRVAVQNHLKVFNARSENGEEIETGKEIKVVKVIADNILVVSTLT